MSWQYSRVGFTGLVASLRVHPVAQKVIPHLQEPLAALVEHPERQPWIDGSLVEQLSKSVFDAGGTRALDEVYFGHVNHRLGGMMIPFVKVALALAKNDPRAFLGRMNVALGPVSKGLRCDWREATPTSGILSVSHGGQPPPAYSVGSWAGILRFGFSLCGKESSFRYAVVEEPSSGAAMDYEVSWI